MSSVALPPIDLPSSRMLPSARTIPQIARSVVDLPAPLAPSNVMTPPWSREKLTSNSACVGP